MLQLEVLIRKSFGAVDAGTTGAIAVEEISTLNHELSDLRAIRFHNPQHSAERNRRFLTYNSVKFAAFVALRPSLGILVLASAVLAKIFCGFGSDVGEELHLDSPQ